VTRLAMLQTHSEDNKDDCGGEGADEGGRFAPAYNPLTGRG